MRSRDGNGSRSLDGWRRQRGVDGRKAIGSPESSYPRVSGDRAPVLEVRRGDTRASEDTRTHRATNWLRDRLAAGLQASWHGVRRARPADDAWNASAWHPGGGALDRATGPSVGQAAGGVADSRGVPAQGHSGEDGHAGASGVGDIASCDSGSG